MFSVNKIIKPFKDESKPGIELKSSSEWRFSKLCGCKFVCFEVLLSYNRTAHFPVGRNFRRK